ncbi:MAG: hypothetical protein Q8M01_20460 [Rubrivivax sp.]|nr:hypothetical protein [Rubrivivax sp.]
MPAWRLALAAAALAAYAGLSHWLMVNAADRPWAVAVLFGPLVLAVAAAGWRQRQPLTLAACALGVAVLAGVVWRGGVEDVNRMYVLQHAGIHLALAWSFGLTLRPGGKALIEMLAERLHHRFSAAMRAYTRRLTLWWVLYFLGMVVVSLAVYMLAPWPWWSLFCNVFTPLAALAFFVGEYVLRYWRHPDFERVSLRRVVAAYRGAADEGSPP